MQLLIFGMSTYTACASVFFLGSAFAQLVQQSQFVAYAINTDGTKALSQSVFKRLKSEITLFCREFEIGSFTHYLC